MNHDIDYYIERYSSLNDFDCPWDVLNDDEVDDLFSYVKPWGILSDAAYGEENYLKYGNSPKERVVNFLKYVKESRHPLLW